MRKFCDLHVHSRYSRATSEAMALQEMARFAALKGLGILGTGDSTHPKWFGEIKEALAQEGSGFLRLKGQERGVLFVLSCEVSTIYARGGSTKRIHHVLLQPDVECAEQVNDLLSNFGDLASDGRPVLKCSSAELVEFVSEVSDWIEVFPAHAWTPHFSLFGLHGFDSVEDCYEDRSGKIHALETGLSSDPP
ncbi:MAG: DNA helicase UvrD, partial [Candidatus Brockarchaeota archaeon]|nr:DNA helicase UvrD [Candidatus Brockarchaeota archaeon]